MKNQHLLNVIGEIDDRYIAEAAPKAKKKGRPVWLKWSAIAAVFGIVVAAAILIIPMLLEKPPAQELSDQVRPYKDVAIRTTEIGYVWPWEYKTIYEKYVSIQIDGCEFIGRQKEISASLTGDFIGTYEATGYCDISEGVYHEQFEVYEITGISSEKLIAVKMEEKYYVFISEEWNPPATFGEALTQYNLSKSIELDRFTIKKRSEEDQYFNLENDDYIWEVLTQCQSAEYVDAPEWVAQDRNYLSFTITSEALGVYKNVLYVTEDGYLWTNVLNGALLYRIGEEAAEKIISYATENAVPGESVPYLYSIVGTITEIGDEYLLIDDSVLCVSAEDGLVFKVMTSDPKISRYLEAGRLAIGDTVQIEYTQWVDLEEGTIIDTAVSISKAIIADGNALIPE